MARTLAIISRGDGEGVVMTANGRGGRRCITGVAAAVGGIVAARVASRLALRALVLYCGHVSVWAFMPVECEFLLWAAALDGAALRFIVRAVDQLHIFASEYY